VAEEAALELPPELGAVVDVEWEEVALVVNSPTIASSISLATRLP
jgi:hypothetical protein